MSTSVAVVLFFGVTVYAVFAGADFGAGFWDLIAGGTERGRRPRGLIEHSIGPLNLWPAAYCNDQFGYLPSKRVMAEGGYENRGLANGTGSFAPEAEDVVIAKVRELAAKAGRPITGFKN